MPGQMLTVAHLCQRYLLTQSLQLQGALSLDKAHLLICPLQGQKLQIPTHIRDGEGVLAVALSGPQAYSNAFYASLWPVHWRPAAQSPYMFWQKLEPS